MNHSFSPKVACLYSHKHCIAVCCLTVILRDTLHVTPYFVKIYFQCSFCLYLSNFFLWHFWYLLLTVPYICLSVFNFSIGIICKGPISVAARIAATPSLGLLIRIPREAWMFVSCECCVLSRKGLCVGLITRPEESYRVWCVWVWSWSRDIELALARQGYCTMGVYLYSANCEACAIYCPVSPYICFYPSPICQVNVRTSNVRLYYHFIFRIRYACR